MSRLEDLTKCKDVTVARRAREVLAVIDLFLRGDLKLAETGFRLVLAVEPDREQVWLLLMGLMVIKGDDAGHILVCQDLLKRSDTAFHRFLLAKAQERAGQFDKAEATLRAAVKQYPKYPLSQAGLAALLLRKDNDAARKEAGKLLDRAESLLPKDSGEADQDKLAIVRAIELGLRGEATKARRLLQGVLDRDPGNPHAKAALEVIKE